MPRIINLSNASECSLNNPYYKVTATIRERYQYEWIEQILINELSIFPVTGRTYTLSFEDFPALADLFNVVGLLRNNTLRFSDQVTLSDSYASYIQRYAFSYCAAYVDRVEADGGEVVDETGTCSAFGYFSPSIPTSGYSYTFTEGITAGDVFNLMGVTGQINLTFNEDLLILDVFVTLRTRGSNESFMDPVNVLDAFSYSTSSNKDISFSDVLSLNDSFVATPARGRNTFFTDQLSVADQFVLSKVAGSNVNFLEAVIMSEVFNVFTQGGYSLFFDDAVEVSDLPAVMSVTGGSNLSLNDVLFLTDQFAVNKTSGRNLNFQESLAVSDAYASYIQRYDGSRCQIYVDRVEVDGGEVVDEMSVCAAFGYFASSTPTLGYSYTYNEALALADVFNIVGLSRQYRISFNDVIELVDTYTPTVTWKSKIFLEDNVSINDLFSVNKQVQLLLSFLDSVQIVDTNGIQTTITRARLSFSDGLMLQDQFNTDITSGVFLSFVDFVNILVADGLAIDTDTNKNLIFSEAITTAEVNERFIQRYEGTFCQTYVERVEADGGEVIDPNSVCTALGYFSDGANPITGYRLTFEDVLGVLTFESVITNVKRSFTFAFMDDIGPAETFSSTRSRNFTLSFTEQLDLSASN